MSIPTVAPITVHRQRPAMATLFEIWLAGDDEEHLTALAEAALDEVTRVEQRLSRFDPASEIHRLNRSGGAPVRLDVELTAILADCRRWWETTDGWFDIAAAAGRGWELPEALALDAPTRTARLLDPAARLDLGGYGKGYALDAAARLLAEYGLTAWLLHGGGSSIVARGAPPGARGWRIGLRDPLEVQLGAHLEELLLSDASLSHSATFDPSRATSDVLDPRTGRPLESAHACVAIAPTATSAEVWSTALLAMGRERAVERLRRPGGPPRVLWIDASGSQTVTEWLAGG